MGAGPCPPSQLRSAPCTDRGRELAGAQPAAAGPRQAAGRWCTGRRGGRGEALPTQRRGPAGPAFLNGGFFSGSHDLRSGLILDSPERMGTGHPSTLTRNLPCLGSLGEGITSGQRGGRPQAPPHGCSAFIWQNGAYQNHQLNKHTNPRLVRENPLPELFISCSQAPRTAPCQQHRRRPDCYTAGVSLSAAPLLPSPPTLQGWLSLGRRA